MRFIGSTYRHETMLKRCSEHGFLFCFCSYATHAFRFASFSGMLADAVVHVFVVTGSGPMEGDRSVPLLFDLYSATAKMLA